MSSCNQYHTHKQPLKGFIGACGFACGVCCCAAGLPAAPVGCCDHPGCMARLPHTQGQPGTTHGTAIQVRPSTLRCHLAVEIASQHLQVVLASGKHFFASNVHQQLVCMHQSRCHCILVLLRPSLCSAPCVLNVCCAAYWCVHCRPASPERRPVSGYGVRAARAGARVSSAAGGSSSGTRLSSAVGCSPTAAGGPQPEWNLLLSKHPQSPLASPAVGLGVTSRHGRSASISFALPAADGGDTAAGSLAGLGPGGALAAKRAAGQQGLQQQQQQQQRPGTAGSAATYSSLGMSSVAG
jgi:hypothetical protein